MKIYLLAVFFLMAVMAVFNDSYMIRGFTDRYFLTEYRYILENKFYFVNPPDYCFKTSIFRIFCVNSFLKVLPSQYKGPSTQIFRTSLLYTFIVYRKKEMGFLAKFFSKYFLWANVLSQVLYQIGLLF